MKRKAIEADVRDEIVSYLKKERRPLRWLEHNTDIKYPTLYACFTQRLFKLSDVNLAKINKGLGTDFKN